MTPERYQQVVDLFHAALELEPDARPAFRSEQEIASMPGAHWISAPGGAPGPTSEIYAFEKRTIQRNLYRIPIR